MGKVNGVERYTESHNDSSGWKYVQGKKGGEQGLKSPGMCPRQLSG